jgi:dTDP-4-amino-4,6-dideoxygalactose transaminase
MKVKFFDWQLQFKSYEKEYLEIIHKTLSNGHYIMCDEHDEFEKEIAKFIGVKHAIGVSNGTESLLLCNKAIGLKENDEVITVSHSFVATSAAIRFLGAKPVFVDILNDRCMDVSQVEGKITSKTKAIVPVQLNGRVCSNMDKLVEISRKYSIPIIEDAAQGLGAKYKGKMAGTFGLYGSISFYPSKVLGAFGDAGLIVTNDDDYAHKIRLLRNNGRDTGTDVEDWGLNCRLDTIHAAILSFKLKMLPGWLKRRREIAALYNEGLKDIPQIGLPPAPVENGDHYDIYQNYEIEAENKENLVKYLSQNEIGTIYQWGNKAIHQYFPSEFKDVKLPRTEEFFKKCLLIPMYPELTNDQVSYVIDKIRKFYNK